MSTAGSRPPLAVSTFPDQKLLVVPALLLILFVHQSGGLPIGLVGGGQWLVVQRSAVILAKRSIT